MKSTPIIRNSALVLFLLFALTATARSQTTLVAGDIAFSGYLGFGASVTVDQFSFVLLRNISSGTVINFTDHGWLSTGVLQSGTEFTLTWTATSALSAGQEIRIVGTTATLASGPGTPGNVTGTALALSANGDQVLAYQGSAASPTFIAGIHSNVYTVANGDAATTTAALWDGIANTFNSSALPPGLATGVNSIWIGTQGNIGSERDNARFVCGSAPITTVAQVRAALNNQANWQVSDGDPAGFSLPTGCAYLAPSAAGIELAGRVVTSSGRGIANATVTLVKANGQVLTVRTGSFGFFRFEDLDAGTTVTVLVSAKRFRFSEPSQVVVLTDGITEITFVTGE